MGFFVSFLTVSVGGALLSSLLPSGGTGKTVKLLISFTVCFTLILLAAKSLSEAEFPAADFSASVENEKNEDAERLTAMGIESGLCKKTAELIEKYTGSRPTAVDCTVSFSGKEFVLEKIKIYMPDRDRTTVFARLASELGINYDCIELCEVS